MESRLSALSGNMVEGSMKDFKKDSIIIGKELANKLEILRRNDPALSASFERWVSDGETKIRNQATAIQDLMAMQDFSREVAAIQNILGLAPDLPLAQTVMANTLYQSGDLQTAESYYRGVLRYASSFAYYDALVGLGNVAARRGQREQAQEFYERAIARNPYQVVAFRNLASVLRGGDAERLRSALERGLLFNPQDAELDRLLTALPAAP